MYKTQRCTKDFNLQNLKDVVAYNEILNNPLCSIISKEIITTKDKETEEGITREIEEVHVIITYDEKQLL